MKLYGSLNLRQQVSGNPGKPLHSSLQKLLSTFQKAQMQWVALGQPNGYKYVHGRGKVWVMEESFADVEEKKRRCKFITSLKLG